MDHTHKTFDTTQANDKLAHPVLRFTSDGYYYPTVDIETDGQWHEVGMAKIKVTPQGDGFLLEYEDSFYKNSPMWGPNGGSNNWNDSTQQSRNKEILLKPSEEETLALYYPRYEYATGFTNNLCICNVLITEK